MSTFKSAKNHEALGDEFYDRVAPADFPKTILRHRDQRWAKRLGLEHLDTPQWIAHFGRFEPLSGSFATPLALRYHGHQFRSYNPDLGDGRGFLFAQLHDLVDDRLLDLGTKGSGRTPWSRGGDGRLTLKGGVREILATEMLDALGVNTSKSLSLIETGEALQRGDEPSPTRSAVLVRLSHSHIRIGSFQRLAYLEDTANTQKLLDYTLATYYPDLINAADPPAAFLAALTRRVAVMGAQWVAAGFVHGVLNTDNINVTGESFDYGPWRFLPHYDPDFTAAYFDTSRLYSFGRQPDALAWNLTRLAECLLPLGRVETLEPALNQFWPLFRAELGKALLMRLALRPNNNAADTEFAETLFTALGATNAPYEQFFFDWRGGEQSLERANSSPSAHFYAQPEFAPLIAALKTFAPAANANLSHLYFARKTPRTMLIEEVEAIWAPIAADDDWSLFGQTLAEIAQMRDAYGIVP